MVVLLFYHLTKRRKPDRIFKLVFRVRIQVSLVYGVPQCHDNTV